MTGRTPLWRQVNPHWVRDGRVTSQRPAHTLIAFSGLSGNAARRVAERLRTAAVRRGWHYRVGAGTPVAVSSSTVLLSTNMLTTTKDIRELIAEKAAARADAMLDGEPRDTALRPK